MKHYRTTDLGTTVVALLLALPRLRPSVPQSGPIFDPNNSVPAPQIGPYFDAKSPASVARYGPHSDPDGWAPAPQYGPFVDPWD